jgi:hypothetical protein|tara:strand:- start:6 stop:581 length:576 start_codon:yes stop_codon:yes gene_type:complete
MAKATMQKWQRDHFVSELNRNYDPLINAAELKLKSIEAEAIEIAEKNLADDIGATPIINELEEAMETLKQKMSKAARFFNKTKHAKKDISYKFKEKDFSLFGYNSTRITPDDCWEQIRDWAGDFAREKIKQTPEGKILATLEENKRASYKEIMEAGSPDSLKQKLHTNLQKDGLSWNREVKALPPIDETIN